MPGIRLRALTRKFQGKRIFESGELESGGPGWIALRGPNGGGKTTLLRTLATLIAPSAGEAWIAGESVVENPSAVRARLGWVPATDGGFFRKLNGRENLELFAGLRGIPRREAARSIELWSEVFPLRDALASPFEHASSGMRQSLSICRALLHDPEVVLLDEPSSSLDPEACASLHASLAVLASTKTILMSTHREEEWRRAGRVWELRDGFLRETQAREHESTAAR